MDGGGGRAAGQPVSLSLCLTADMFWLMPACLPACLPNNPRHYLNFFEMVERPITQERGGIVLFPLPMSSGA